MTRQPASPVILLAGFAVLVGVLAAIQFRTFHDAQPAPDSLEYFEEADQIQQVGYGPGLSLHWSPLYPVYLLAVRRLTALPIDRELAVTAAADVVLLVVLCAIVATAYLSIGRLCLPDRDETARAWLACACGLAVYFAFALLRVGLRMPDALVTSLAVLTLWAWCHAMARGLDLRWAALAGLLSGAAFLARANLLHWSIVVAGAACVLALGAGRARRGTAYAVFLAGLMVIVGPQTYLLSSTRGAFTFGESGKLVFAETYGAIWPNGQAWPVRVSAGNFVRVFTETRDLNYPGFFEPGREYDDATVPIRVTKTILSVVRSVRSTLFGYWSSSFALMWPLLWVLWPLAFFGVGALAPGGARPDGDWSKALRQRVSWFLIAAGAAGVAMHMLSFSIGYYLPPYLIPLFLGLYLQMLSPRADDPVGSTLRRRAVWIVAAGLVLAATLSTASTLRVPDSGRSAAAADSHAIAAALSAFPAREGGRRRIAVSGPWLGVYGVRLANSQVIADIPDPAVLHDAARAARATRELRDLGVVAILVARTRTLPDDPLKWRAVTSEWAIVDLQEPSSSAAPQ